MLRQLSSKLGCRATRTRYGSPTGVADYSPHPAWAISAGVGALSLCIFTCATAAMPWTSIAALLGGNHKLELGASISAVVSDEARFLPGPVVAYRYQPAAGGFFFRASLNGFVTFDEEIPFIPWPGLTLGWTWTD